VDAGRLAMCLGANRAGPLLPPPSRSVMCVDPVSMQSLARLCRLFAESRGKTSRVSIADSCLLRSSLSFYLPPPRKGNFDLSREYPVQLARHSRILVLGIFFVRSSRICSLRESRRSIVRSRSVPAIIYADLKSFAKGPRG